ncbi:TPA: UvrD-helicase domain-containing protein [Burkholderia vietnamiensis]|nr:UvrD-helicase domain-containing protein [Burkholderia vietnamiensis]
MNPFELSRIEATKLRDELKVKGIDLHQSGYQLVEATCKALDVTLKKVKPSISLLKGADATINVARKWALVRNDVSDEVKAFLIAHELGHLRLHPTTTGTVEVTQSALTGDAETNGAKEVESYGAREREELQANVFAREFLLPRDFARSSFLDDRQGATALAHQRGLPVELVRLQLYDAVLLPHVSVSAKTFKLPDGPTEAQEPAVNSDATTTLVEAGPGTGKTTTLLLRLRRLIKQGVSPDSIVILTFSNKAARELVERARAGNIPGADRVWIGTFHAFGLEFLRKFGNLHGLESRFPVLDKLATLAMLETDVPSLDLEAFDPLSNPSPWLENIVDTIRRAKDEVFDAEQFAAAANLSSSGDAEVDAKRRDVATIFSRYELLLSRRKAVDLTDLLCVSIRLMQSDDPNVTRFLTGIRHVMVDEYQDVNRASALLVKVLSRAAQTLWVVGDANQAIYAFMGASSSNLENFQVDFPGAVSIPLLLNHRSSQEIVDVFGKVASRNPAGRLTVSLEAERGYVGHGPRIVSTTGEREQISALAWRIRELQAQDIPLAEQAIIVYKNATAADIAMGLEQLGIPVLYLGNIFERQEVKDLICLLQLAIDPYGVNLVREWHSPLLALTRSGADSIFAQTRQQQMGWRDVTGEGLTKHDDLCWQNLRRLCALLKENMSPWDALAAVLLDDGAWLRELAGHSGQAAANALMAVWQFVHFCRSPDGTGRWSTVKNLSQRIRDRIRLGEDRSMRAVPPEAEGMDAIRILTAHGSKGLEFDAVHFLSVTKSIYEEPKSTSNKLLPDAVLDSNRTLDILKNERHNLLYVAVSRPRLYLTIYATAVEELPEALSGLLQPLDGGWEKQVREKAAPQPGPSGQAVVSLEEYLQFVKCPQRHEMSTRAGRAQHGDLKLYQAVDLATRRAMTALSADASLLLEDKWQGEVQAALTHFSLHEHVSAHAIREKVEQRVKCGRDRLLEGGATNAKVPMELGPLRVELEPDQIFQANGTQRLRFIRSHESSLKSMKQPLAALLDAHHQAGGTKMSIEVTTLSNEETTSVGTIKAPTRAKYQTIAIGLCSKHFPTSPESERTCDNCAYMFPCNRRVSD